MSKGISEKISGTVGGDNALKEFEYGEDLDAGTPIGFKSNGKIYKFSALSGFSTNLGGTNTNLPTLTNDEKNVTSVYDPVNEKLIIYQRNENQGGDLYYFLCTVVGSTVTIVGSGLVTGEEGNNITCYYDTASGKTVLAYKYSSGIRGVVGTVVGNSMTFPSPITIDNSGVFSQMSSVYDENSNKGVIAFRGANGTRGKAVVITVSGTSISFGAVVNFSSGDIRGVAVSYDAVTNKVVISYRDVAISNQGASVVGTVSGTSISFGSPVIFEANIIEEIHSCFNSGVGKIVVTYIQGGNTKLIIGTVSGTSISFGTQLIVVNTSHVTVTCNYNPVLDLVFVIGSDTVAYLINIIGDTATLNNSHSIGTTNRWANFVYDSNTEQVVFVGGRGIVKAIVGDLPELVDFFGVAQTTALTGTTNNVALQGDTSTVHTGTAGDIAYIQTDGSIGPTVTAFPAGRYISSTKIRLTKKP